MLQLNIQCIFLETLYVKPNGLISVIKSMQGNILMPDLNNLMHIFDFLIR